MSSADPCLYINHSQSLYVFVYVDDLLIIGNSSEFSSRIKQKFRISHKGPLSKILGNHFIQTKSGSPLLHQPNHISTALEELGLTESKPISTPLTPNIKFKPASDEDHQKILNLNINFCTSTGFLNYIASRTRPDLSYSVSCLSRFNNKPGLSHWNEAKHVWRYVNATKDLALKLHSSSFAFDIECYSDSDGGNDPTTRRSHSGYLLLLYGCPVSWHSKLQTTVSLSSTEGELKALVLATQEKLWLLNLIKELNPNLQLTHCLYIDNKALNDLVTLDSHHGALKHIDTQIKWLQEQRDKNFLITQLIPSGHMLANALTKPAIKPSVELLTSSLMSSHN